MKATTDGNGGEIFVIYMPACKIIDLAEVLIQHFGKEVNIIETGRKPGEKLHKVLVSHNEIENTVVYNQEYFVVLPNLNIPGVRELYSTCQPINESSYSSNDDLMTHEEIKKMLIKSKLLH